MWVRSACPWRRNISACAVTVCLLAAWLAGPAEANGPVAGLTAPVTAVQQTAGQVVTTVEASAVRSSASPRSAARVSKARAAVADPVARTVTAVQATAAAQPVTSGAATTVRTASKGAAKTARSATNSAATTARTTAERAGSKPAVTAARERLVAAPATTASYTASRLGEISLTATPSGLRSEAATTQPAMTPLGAVAGTLTLVRPAVAAKADSPADAAPIADGPARLEPVARRGRELTAFSAPASQPTGPASAGSSTGGVGTAGLVGLLGILLFVLQRLGTLVRLQPEWAPMPPFLALPERPG